MRTDTWKHWTAFLFAAWPALTEAAGPEPREIDPPAAPGATAPATTPDGDGVLASWWEPRGEAWALRLARLDAGGWSPAHTVVQPEGALVNWADTPQVARAGDGALVAWWPQRSAGAAYTYDVQLARSTDEGAHWTPLGPAHDDGTPTEHGFVSMVPEGDGLRLTWLDGRATVEEGPMALRTALVGETVGPSTVLDPRTCDCCGTATVQLPTGPAVVYRDRSPTEVRDPALVRWTGEGWTAPAPVGDDDWVMPGCPVNGPRAAVAGDRLAVAWTTGAGGARVEVAFSEDRGAHFGPAVVVDAPSGDGQPLGRVDLVALPDGAAVLWLGAGAGDARILLRRVGADGRLGAAVEVGRTTSDRSSGFPRLARLGEELVVTWTLPGPPSGVVARALPLASLPPPTEAGVTVAPASPELSGLVQRLPADFEARDLQGKPVRLGDLGSRPVLVDLWASWCAPCMAQLPVLEALARAHPELVVVAIAVDDQEDRVRALAAERGWAWPVLLDRSAHVREGFGADALPTTLLFDAAGARVWAHLGPLAAEHADLDAALGPGPGPRTQAPPPPRGPGPR